MQTFRLDRVGVQIGVLALISLVAGSALFIGGGGSPRAPGSVPPDEFKGPFPQGQAISVPEAEASVSFPLYLPDSPAASTANITGAWADNAGDVAFEFNNNVMLMMWRSSYADVEAALSDFVSTTTATAHLIDVGGSPGVLVSPNTDRDNLNPAWLEFVREGVDINLYSDTASTDDLMQIAGTMQQVGTVPAGA